MYVEKVKLEDRSARLFGRGADMDLLRARVRVPGVTAVVGQPQMGKSWLLMETARRLAEEGWAGEVAAGTGLNLEARPMVGFVNEAGADMLSRGMRDLYLRWLEDATYREQLREKWEANKEGLVGRAGAAFGTLAKAVFAFQGPHGAAIGGMVKELFDGLEKAGQDERQVGQQFARLPLDDARHLLWIMHEVTGRSAALFFDQWEDSPKVEEEARTLRNFLRAIKDSDDRWPPCHIVIGLRDENKAAVKAAEELHKNFGDHLCHCHRLLEMELGGGEAERLLVRLRAEVPATREVADGELLEMIGGYPCVPNRWLDRVNARRMVGLKDLKEVADDAHHFRYPEFERELDGLTDDERRVAIRLALLPGASGAAGWAALKPVVLRGVSPGCVDKLLAKGYFQSVKPPSYGHAKRAEAAVACLKEKCFSGMGEEAEELVLQLAGKVRISEATVEPFELGLTEMQRIARELGISDLGLALVEAARSLFGLKSDASSFDDLDVTVVAAASAPLLAVGLFNTLYRAKQEEDLPRRDSLLVDLRSLAEAYPDDAAVREQLAKGLYNTLNDAKREDNLPRRDNLLEELRGLAEAYPEDAVVREQLAKGLLFNTLVDAKQEEDLPRRDSLLVDLLGLAEEHPEDAAVREQLAKGLLFNTLVDAKQEDDLPRRDSLLVDLRVLAEAYPDDAAVRENLAMSLYNTLNDAKQENDLPRRDGLLEELRELVARFPENEYLVREIVPRLDEFEGS